MSRFVKVDFLSDRSSESSNGYIYEDKLSRALKKYDTVIVPTRYGLTIAVVKGTYNEEQKNNLMRNKYRFSQSDIRAVAEKIKSKAVEDIVKADKVADIKRKLESEVKKIDEVKKFEAYAELSPEVAAMLEELKELNG